MIGVLVTVAIVITAPPVRADSVDEHLARARDFHDRGDFIHTRDELLAAYELDPRSDLLFALGQVELNLGHYQAAIDYYRRFLATRPPAEQEALAEQAIGAARTELSRPAVVALPRALPPPRRHWDTFDSALLGLGWVAMAAAGGLFYNSYELDRDHSGTLRAYDSRVALARTRRTWAGVLTGCGALAISVAVLRWQLHLTTIELDASPQGAVVKLEHAL